MLARHMTRGVVAGVVTAVMALATPLPAAAQGAVGPFAGFKHDSKAPIEIASDSLEVQQAQGEATFVGEVQASQGTLRLTAQRLVVSYDTGEEGSETGEIQHMRAEGEVFLSNGSETARGAWAEYDVAGGTMRMGGDVVLTQGENAISGEALVLDLDAGTGRVEGREGDRVKSIFTPSGGAGSGGADNE